MKRYIAIVLPFILAACSTTPSAPVSAAPEVVSPVAAGAPAKAEQDVVLAQADAGVKCEKTYVVGSHLPVKKCTTAEQRDTESKAARAAMESMHHNAIAPNVNGGKL
ncbi:MAG: hypothetical protein V4582_14315 [Pseudomonadota bacterium]